MQKTRKRDLVPIILNILIVVFVVCGTYAMLTNKESGSGLTASGVENLKYFTVLSNEFCGIVAILWLCLYFTGKKTPVLAKLMGASATGLTFLIIAAFLQPMYPDLNLYKGGNFWFHLVVPLIAMAEFVLSSDGGKVPFRYTVFSAMLALLYGSGYLINILLNGIGTWPESNDWYGFLNWGFPVGIAIFAVVVLMDFGIACLLRFLNGRVGNRTGKN